MSILNQIVCGVGLWQKDHIVYGFMKKIQMN